MITFLILAQMTPGTLVTIATAWFVAITAVVGGLALLIKNIKPSIVSILSDIDSIKKRQDRQGDRIDAQGDKLADVALKTPTAPVAPAPIIIQVPTPVAGGGTMPVEVKNEPLKVEEEKHTS